MMENEVGDANSNIATETIIAPRSSLRYFCRTARLSLHEKPPMRARATIRHRCIAQTSLGFMRPEACALLSADRLYPRQACCGDRQRGKPRPFLYSTVRPCVSCCAVSSPGLASSRVHRRIHFVDPVPRCVSSLLKRELT